MNKSNSMQGYLDSIQAGMSYDPTIGKLRYATRAETPARWTKKSMYVDLLWDSKEKVLIGIQIYRFPLLATQAKRILELKDRDPLPLRSIWEIALVGVFTEKFALERPEDVWPNVNDLSKQLRPLIADVKILPEIWRRAIEL